MADALRERTARLLADYLEYCARQPGSPVRAPSTREAAVLRSVAEQDGFCLFFTPMLLSSWKRLLVQALLSCFMAVILIYFWKRLPTPFGKISYITKALTGMSYLREKCITSDMTR